MATVTWRKAYGAIKDHTKVGLAQINSDYKDLDVAIVKATNHVECPPKERHLRKILIATSAIRPRADVVYCLNALARRLAKTRNWTVALKTLIVVHRLLREGDPTFREELLAFSQHGRILRLSNFKDDSSSIAWDSSAWVRTYALFLEERLECYRVLKYDIEAERLLKPAEGQEKGYSRTRNLDSDELLEQLPALQQLLYRLIGCRPEGAALGNYVIQYALALVLKESFKIYCGINDGIINLVDKFFEMPRHDAVKALEIYRRAGTQATNLSEFYNVCKASEIARNFQFPVLREPPQTFLATMEEYIREAPKEVTLPVLQLELPERLLLTYKPEENSHSVDDRSTAEEHQSVTSDDPTSSARAAPVTTPALPSARNMEIGDLLGLDDVTPDAVIEESNALALAIVSSDAASSSITGTASAKEFDPTGWELALVTTPSSDAPIHTERELAGGLDSLTLNSLYDEATYRVNQQTLYGAPAPNPFEVQDPFAMSNNIAPPAAVQMNSLTQQPPHNPFGPYQAPFHAQSQPPVGLGAPNPFTDMEFEPYAVAPVNHLQHSTNPFENSGLL